MERFGDLYRILVWNSKRNNDAIRTRYVNLFNFIKSPFGTSIQIQIWLLYQSTATYYHIFA